MTAGRWKNSKTRVTKHRRANAAEKRLNVKRAQKIRRKAKRQDQRRLKARNDGSA